MRRLTAWLYRVAFGLQIKTHEQHIADLRQMLDEQMLAAQHIDAAIEITTDRLLQSQVRRDAAAKRFEQVDTRPSLVEQRLPDAATRSF